MIATALLAGALGAYAIAWVLHLQSFRGGAHDARRRSTTIALAAVSLHASGLIALWMTYLAPPLVGFGPASTTLALAIATAFLATSRTSEGWTAGLMVLPAVIALLAAALWSGVRPATPATSFEGPWFVVHVVSVLLGYAILLLGSVAAAMYLLQFRALKRKDFGNVFRSFPSLESLDRMNSIALGGGLAALTLGLLAGWSFTLTFGQGLALSDPDVEFGLLTWTAFAAALALRLTPGGRGQRAAGLTVVAFVACAIAFVILRAFSPARQFFL
ncbi:MAG: cytochrome c biogenesis protein CcsA [Gemmatimonadota bacterium]